MRSDTLPPPHLSPGSPRRRYDPRPPGTRVRPTEEADRAKEILLPGPYPSAAQSVRSEKMNEPDDREAFADCDAFRKLEQVGTVDPGYASRSLRPESRSPPDDHRGPLEKHRHDRPSRRRAEGDPRPLRDRPEPAPVLLVCLPLPTGRR